MDKARQAMAHNLAMLKHIIRAIIVIAAVLQILSLIFGGGATFPDAH